MTTMNTRETIDQLDRAAVLLENTLPQVGSMADGHLRNAIREIGLAAKAEDRYRAAPEPARPPGHHTAGCACVRCRKWRRERH